MNFTSIQVIFALPSVIKSLNALSCFESYFPIKAGNITHKITPALLTNVCQELLTLARNRVFHEKFESLNYTF